MSVSSMTPRTRRGPVGQRAVLHLAGLDAVLFGPDAVLTDTGRPPQGSERRPCQSLAGLLRQLRAAGIATAVISAGRQCAKALSTAGVAGLFDVVVDQRATAAMGLGSPPDPARYLEAAHRLGADPGRAAVVADEADGVEAGRRGGFRFIIGIGHHGNASELASAGADLVISELAGLSPRIPAWTTTLTPTCSPRGHHLDVRIGQDALTVTSAPGDAAPVSLLLAGKLVRLRPGARIRRSLPAAPASRLTRPHRDRGPGSAVTDPVCGMLIQESAAAGSTTHHGTTYFFCSSTCRELFNASPGHYPMASSAAGTARPRS